MLGGKKCGERGPILFLRETFDAANLSGENGVVGWEVGRLEVAELLSFLEEVGEAAVEEGDFGAAAVAF